MNPQGRSSTFTTAQANKTSSQLQKFVLTRAKDYSLASIDNETIEASKGNANAFLEAATVEIDGALQSATRSLATALYGSGSGSIGQVDASTVLSSSLIQLKNVESVTNFELSMELVVSATDGGGSVRSGVVQIIGVDRDLGQITVNAPLNTAIPAIASQDFIFVQGDYGLKLTGLKGWLPDTSPSNVDNFFSVNRSKDATRLAGSRIPCQSLPIEEAVIQAAARVGREGGRPDTVFMSYSKYADLEKALGSKVIYMDVKVNPEIGFRGILINGPRGPIKVVPDQNCPSDRAYMLQMDVWKLYSLGKCPKILDTDGMKMLRDSNSDSVEVRIGYYAQLGCRAPGWNAVLLFS